MEAEPRRQTKQAVASAVAQDRDIAPPARLVLRCVEGGALMDPPPTLTLTLDLDVAQTPG